MPDRIELPEDLKALAVGVAQKASQLAIAASIRLADIDEQAAIRMTEATINQGDTLMIAVDIGVADAQVRLISISADRRVTQHAAFGLYAPSTSRN